MTDHTERSDHTERPDHTGHPAPRRRRAPLAAVVGAALLVLLGSVLLAPTAQAAGTAPEGTPPGQAWVRVGHFVPGMGATDIELTPLPGTAEPSMALASGATYGQVTSYEKLAPGSYTATVRESTASAGSAPLLSRSFEVTAGQAHTLAVVGTSQEPRLALLTDDLTTPAAGSARVRVLSASEQADSVTITAVDGPTIADGAVLGQATAYATVPAGSWTLQLQGSTPDAMLQDVAIASGSVYTVVVLDAPDDGVQLQVVTDAAGAVVAPKGGAKTGLGGAATPAPQAGSALAVSVGGLLLVLLGGVVVVRRRLVPARVRP